MNILQKPIHMPKIASLKQIAALKPARFPDKTTINLCIFDKNVNRPSKIVPLVILGVLVLFLFTRFGVVGRWQAVERAETAARDAQTQLAQLKEYTQNYETLRLEYDQHFPAEGQSLSSLADRMDLLALVEKVLLSAGRLEYFTVEENILSAKLSGVALDDTAGILDQLYANPLVTDVSVYTADKKTESAIPSVLMTINLGQVDESEETEETP